jgi:hypothetical protein
MPITRIRRQLEYYKDRPLLQHYQLVVSHANDLQAILPREESRFHKQRLQVLETINYCKKKLNF